MIKQIFIIAFLLIINTFSGIVFASSNNNSSTDKEKNDQIRTLIGQNSTETKTGESKVDYLNFPKIDEKPTADELRDRKIYFLKWLADAHKEGKYLNVTEDMINSLTDEELYSLINIEFLTTGGAIEESTDMLRNRNEMIEKELETGIPSEEDISDDFSKTTDYNDLYSLDEEKQDLLIQAIKDYTEEKQGTLALIALGASSGLYMLNIGKKLLDNETAENREKRKKLLSEHKKQSLEDVSNFEEDYTKYYKDNYSYDDNLRNITEGALGFYGTTAQQQKLAELNRELRNVMATSTMLSYEQFKKEMNEQDSFFNYKSELEKRQCFVEYSGGTGAKERNMQSWDKMNTQSAINAKEQIETPTQRLHKMEEIAIKTSKDISKRKFDELYPEDDE